MIRTSDENKLVERIPYTLRRHPRAKRVRILISRDRKVIVSMPSRFSKNVAEKFVADKTDWINSVVAALPAQKTLTTRERRQQAKTARILVHRLVDEYSRRYGFRVREISIRHQRTRWGSCSTAGHLSFNARIVALPDDLQKYIIIHELAHTKEHNHSPKFWALVESILPDYRLQRAALRHQPLL